MTGTVFLEALSIVAIVAILLLRRPLNALADRLSGKAGAIEWLERALAPGASIHAQTGRGRNVAVAAEALLALSGAAGAANE